MSWTANGTPASIDRISEVKTALREGTASGLSHPLESASFSRAEEAAQFILALTLARPAIAVVLGSGLGSFADEIRDATTIRYEDIPHFPKSTAIGHAGHLVIGSVEGLPLVVMRGRVHLYEGYSAHQVAFPIRVLARMGIRAVVLTTQPAASMPITARALWLSCAITSICRDRSADLDRTTIASVCAIPT